MKFCHPNIGDVVKVKHSGAGIECVALVTGELIYYNKDSATVPLRLSVPHKGAREVTVHNTAVEVISEA